LPPPVNRPDARRRPLGSSSAERTHAGGRPRRRRPSRRRTYGGSRVESPWCLSPPRWVLAIAAPSFVEGRQDPAHEPVDLVEVAGLHEVGGAGLLEEFLLVAAEDVPGEEDHARAERGQEPLQLPVEALALESGDAGAGGAGVVG